MVHISNINTMNSIYYADFHSIIKYGIFFGGNSSNSGKIFTLYDVLNETHEIFQTDSSVRNINSRNKHQLHRPNVNQSSINIFYSWPRSETILKRDKTKFKAALRKYLNTHFFNLQMNFICKNDL